MFGLLLGGVSSFAFAEPPRVQNRAGGRVRDISVRELQPEAVRCSLTHGVSLDTPTFCTLASTLCSGAPPSCFPSRGQVVGRGRVAGVKLKPSVREVGTFKGIIRIVDSESVPPLFDIRQVL
jgi:hypothetical protein